MSHLPHERSGHPASDPERARRQGPYVKVNVKPRPAQLEAMALGHDIRQAAGAGVAFDQTCRKQADAAIDRAGNNLSCGRGWRTRRTVLFPAFPV